MTLKPHHLRTLRRRQTGFNFAEVLFAVMILGIGFIMVAAIFPVALMQSKTTVEETTAATIARGGVNYIQTVSTDAAMPDTGGIFLPCAKNTATPIWDAVKGNLVSASDRRIAAAMFYRRNGDSPLAQVVVIPMITRNQDTFDKGNIDDTLQPQAVTIDVANNLLTITAGAAAAAGEGAYVVISDDNDTGRLNGHVFRLATFNGTAWEMVPGWDLLRDPGNDELFGTGDDVVDLDDAEAFIIGRGMLDPTVVGSPLEGLSQDVAAYSTFVQIR